VPRPCWSQGKAAQAAIESMGKRLEAKMAELPKT
jgi:hypothetical protein